MYVCICMYVYVINKCHQGYCDDGEWIECDENGITFTEYENDDCSGESNGTFTLTANECDEEYVYISDFVCETYAFTTREPNPTDESGNTIRPDTTTAEPTEYQGMDTTQTPAPVVDSASTVSTFFALCVGIVALALN